MELKRYWSRSEFALLTGLARGQQQRTNGEGGSMMVLHASATESFADLFRFIRAARLG